VPCERPTQDLFLIVRRHYQPRVDAPGDARRIFGLIRRVVRAAMCAVRDVANRLRARKGARRSGPNQSQVLAALVDKLSRFRLVDHCAISLLRSSHAQQSHSRERLCRRGWSLVNPASRHESPDDASHLVGQRHPHQHRRLARYHTRHPRAHGSPIASYPAHDSTGPTIRRRRKVSSPIFPRRLSLAGAPYSHRQEGALAAID
jgi:hypothetical protein